MIVQEFCKGNIHKVVIVVVVDIVVRNQELQVRGDLVMAKNYQQPSLKYASIRCLICGLGNLPSFLVVAT